MEMRLTEGDGMLGCSRLDCQSKLVCVGCLAALSSSPASFVRFVRGPPVLTLSAPHVASADLLLQMLQKRNHFFRPLLQNPISRVNPC